MADIMQPEIPVQPIDGMPTQDRPVVHVVKTPRRRKAVEPEASPKPKARAKSPKPKSDVPKNGTQTGGKK